MAISIRRLESDDLLDQFDCGDHPLNDYLKRHAWANQSRNLIGVTYVAVEDAQSRIVLGYYTLAASAISRDLLPVELTKELPRHRNLPVTLLARLAVSKPFQKSGLGGKLLWHALRNVLALSEHLGFRFLLVDAYPSAAGWYARYGFVAIEGTGPGHTQSMFIDIRTIEAATG